MKRNLTIALILMGGVALFALLVHNVLVVANVSIPAATTVYGSTPRRLWATAAMIFALAGVAMGGLSLRRSLGNTDKARQRNSIIALILGVSAIMSGGLNLAMANGGPGSGNGVVGGAIAIVLGMLAIAMGGILQIRIRAHR